MASPNQVKNLRDRDSSVHKHLRDVVCYYIRANPRARDLYDRASAGGHPQAVRVLAGTRPFASWHYLQTNTAHDPTHNNNNNKVQLLRP